MANNEAECEVTISDSEVDDNNDQVYIFFLLMKNTTKYSILNKFLKFYFHSFTSICLFACFYSLIP